MKKKQSFHPQNNRVRTELKEKVNKGRLAVQLAVPSPKLQLSPPPPWTKFHHRNTGAH